MISPQAAREQSSLSLEELAIEAEVDTTFVRRLIALGALERKTGPEPYGPPDVGRVQLLRSWELAGFPAEALVDLFRTAELSDSWVDAAATTRAQPLDLTYEQVCREQHVPLALMRALQGALGFAPPDPHDHAREGEPDLAAMVKAFLAAGVPLPRILAVVRVYADCLRRVAKAEAELYETEIEEPLRRRGQSERQLLDHGVGFSDGMIASLERVVLGIYRRQREHVWIEHCIAHAELALERAGLQERIARPPAICFVDLTGYTRIIEKRGDEVAAQLATKLTSLVEDIARCHAGRPIRWLGDGGMFHFKEPGAAVVSGLDMVERAPRVGLPPMHIGIHTGPVIYQDGDVYGSTVNLASRIASYAGAGQVLASDETVRRSADRGVHFEPLGPVRLNGVSKPLRLHWAVRDSHG